MATAIIVYVPSTVILSMALNIHAWRFFSAIPLIRWQCQKSEFEILHQLFTPVKSATTASFGIFLHNA